MMNIFELFKSVNCEIISGFMPVNRAVNHDRYYNQDVHNCYAFRYRNSTTVERIFVFNFVDTAAAHGMTHASLIDSTVKDLYIEDIDREFLNPIVSNVTDWFDAYIKKFPDLWECMKR